MQTGDSSDTNAPHTCWDRATLKQQLVSASSRGIGIEQRSLQQDFLHAEVRPAAANDESIPDTARGRSSSKKKVSNTQLNNTNMQLKFNLRASEMDHEVFRTEQTADC